MAPSGASAERDLLVVGRIGKPHGLLGAVTVEVRTDDPAARFAVGATLETDPAQRGPLTVESTRDHSGRMVVTFRGVGDRTAAETLRGTLLVIDAVSLPDPDDADVFHDHQLVGLAAEYADGRPLGVVAEVLHLPQGDVLAVHRPDGREVLVPFLLAMVPVVDVAHGRLVVDPPEGLLELTGGPDPDA